MEEKIKEFWKQKQVAFYHIFLDVMLLIYCISFYFAGNQVVTIRYVILFVYALLCIVTELVHNRHMQKKICSFQADNSGRKSVLLFAAGTWIGVLLYGRDKIRGNYFPDTVPDLFL